MIDMRGTGITAANAAQNIMLTEYAEGGVLIEFGTSEIWLENIMQVTLRSINDFILN